MPTPASKRNYKQEAARETPARKEARRERMKARYDFEKAHGNLPTDMQVDHKTPLSEGGANTPGNLRAVPKPINESFVRAGPGGKQIGLARGHGKKNR